MCATRSSRGGVIPSTSFCSSGQTNMLSHACPTVTPLRLHMWNANGSAVKSITRWADVFPPPPALPMFGHVNGPATSFRVLSGLPGHYMDWEVAGSALPDTCGMSHPPIQLTPQDGEVFVGTQRVRLLVSPPHQYQASPKLNSPDVELRSQGLCLSYPSSVETSRLTVPKFCHPSPL